MRKYLRWKYAAWLLWPASLILLMLSVHSIPLDAMRETLSGLRVWQLGVLGLLNCLIFILFSLRWWWLARAMGGQTKLGTITAYRLAAFGVNYLTPGPQFGGEPLQVALLTKQQNIPAPDAAASVTLDKLLELIINLGFLVWGLALGLTGSLISGPSGRYGLGLAAGLLAIPLIYLASISSGRLPITHLVGRIPTRLEQNSLIQTLVQFVYDSEKQIMRFCTEQPRVLLGPACLSFLGWGLMILEFWFSMRILNLPVSLIEAFIVMTISRLAFLAPIPGGLGALEAGLLLAISALGYSPAHALSLSLLIRVRDGLLAVLGMMILLIHIPRKLVSAHEGQHDMINIPENLEVQTVVSGIPPAPGVGPHGKI
jgi:uncharacterized protein (TIRG00374 family)